MLRPLLRPVVQRDTALVLMSIGTAGLLGLFSSDIPWWVKVVGFPLAVGLTFWSVLQLIAASTWQNARDGIRERFNEAIYEGHALWKQLHERITKTGRASADPDWKAWVEKTAAWLSTTFGAPEGEGMRLAAEVNFYSNQEDGRPGYPDGAVQAHYKWLERCLARFMNGTLQPL